MEQVNEPKVSLKEFSFPYGSLKDMPSPEARKEGAIVEIDRILTRIEGFMESGEQDALQVKFYRFFKKVLEHSEQLNKDPYKLTISFKDGTENPIFVSFEELSILATQSPAVMTTALLVLENMGVSLDNPFE